MLNIYRSNKTEILSEALAAVLKLTPDHPLKPEWICVQSRGMKQWITLRLAEKFGICSNINFVYPKNLIEFFISNNVPPKKNNGIDKDDFFWIVLKSFFKQLPGEAFEQIRSYIQNDPDGRKKAQLAFKIAGLFDDYLLYRPDMLLKWQETGNDTGPDFTDYNWQNLLWRSIVKAAGPIHQACLAHDFIDEKINLFAKDILPVNKVSLFGITSLPPLFLQILDKVSKSIDVHLFLMVPSDRFFLDMKSKKQIDKMTVNKNLQQGDSLLYLEEGNPLLSSLGNSGREFFSLIEALDYYEPAPDLFGDPAGSNSSLLSFLQSDIYNLVSRQEKHDDLPVVIGEDDSSLSIHACHSPMREAQVLKDILLDAFEKDPGLKPHDIIVMMPDIEAYAPFIESVFSTEHVIPYSISDRKKHTQSDILHAFLKILELKGKRFEKTQIIDLLFCKPVSEKFGIIQEEIPLLQHIVSESNILWGKDPDHRQKQGQPPVFLNTWEFGLHRLFLGMSMPETCQKPVSGVMPCAAIEGTDLLLLGKLASFLDTLFEAVEKLEGNYNVIQWCRILERILNRLILTESSGTEDTAFLIQSINEMRQKALKWKFDPEVPFETVFAYIRRKLDLNLYQGSFLSGKVTFCNLLPMRSIPYKVVALMGMDEKSFPRKSQTPGFDLIRQNRRPGDKNERDEDRYLFLETLLSARSKFIVTYTGMSIQDNSVLPPSSVISELSDTVVQGFRFEANHGFHFFHPLHPFNSKYFTEEFFSYSQFNLRLAKKLNLSKSMERVQISQSFERQENETIDSIDLDQLIYFYRNPLAFFMKEGMGFQLSEIEEAEPEREPFKIESLSKYKVGRRMIDRMAELSDIQDLYNVMEAEGILPYNKKGEVEYHKIRSLAETVIKASQPYTDQSRIPAHHYALACPKGMLTGTLHGLYKSNACQVEFGRINGARLLTGWIRHLFLNACPDGNIPQKTILIGMDPDKGQKPAVFSFEPLKTGAFQILDSFIKIFHEGLCRPFYFSPNSSFRFVQVLKDNEYDLSSSVLEEARIKSMDLWYGNRFLPGESKNRYIESLTRENDFFCNTKALDQSGFIKNSLCLYQPLLDNLRRLK